MRSIGFAVWGFSVFDLAGSMFLTYCFVGSEKFLTFVIGKVTLNEFDNANTTDMIEQIGIYNYKSIREAMIPLKRINILIGENGAGKSNFISFFEMTKALYDQRLGSYMLSNGGVEAQLYRGRKESQAIKGLIDYNNENAFFSFYLQDHDEEIIYHSRRSDRTRICL